jgi:hypothetical protein
MSVEFVNHFENVILFLSNSLSELLLATASCTGHVLCLLATARGKLAMARL